MTTKFDVGGYELEINDSGRLSSPDVMCASSDGRIGLQLMHHPLDERQPSQCVMQAFVKPSQARAIASALLSAATEARDRRL